VGVEPDVRVDDVHIRVLARDDLLDGFDDVLTRRSSSRATLVICTSIESCSVNVSARNTSVFVTMPAMVSAALRRDHQPGDVVVEHAFDDGLRGLVGGRGDDGARHDVVNGDIEHPVDVASAVAAAPCRS